MAAAAADHGKVSTTRPRKMSKSFFPSSSLAYRNPTTFSDLLGVLGKKETKCIVDERKEARRQRHKEVS